MAELQIDTALKGQRPRVARWAAFCGVMVVLIGALLWKDAALDSLLWRGTRWVFGDQERYNWRDQAVIDAVRDISGTQLREVALPWYRTTPPPFGGNLFHHVERIVWVFRDFGEFWMTLIIIAGVGIFHARRWRAALAVLIATAATSGVGALLAAVCGRLRPDGKALAAMIADPHFAYLSNVGNEVRNDGYNFWEAMRGFHGGGDLSFPSGHATLAFATAGALIYFFPRGRVLFLIVAAGCALSRVILQAHFYSDVLAGAMLGLTLGTFVTFWVDGLLGAVGRNAEK